MATASASPMTASPLGMYQPSNTPPQPDPSAPQSVASTSSVTLDDPNTGYQSASNTATSGPSSQQAVIDGTSTVKDEDEDAKLLASLAENMSKGMQDTASLVQPDDTAMSPIKTAAFDTQRVDNSVDMPFSRPAEDASGPIQAYAKLEFPGFSYYIQTLDFTIGRRPAHMRTPTSQGGETQHITGAKKLDGDVDVDLGLLKSISRLHVRIFYQDQPRHNGHFAETSDTHGSRDYDTEGGQGQGRFVLQVLGRNGCFVDDVPVEKDSVVPLGKRTKIQIAERVFYFVLPPVPLAKSYNSDGEVGSGESLDESEDDSGSLGSSDEDEEESSGSASSEEEESEGEESEEIAEEIDVKKRPKLVLKKKPVPETTGGKGKGKGKGKQQGKTIWAGKGLPLNKRRKVEDEEVVDEDESEEEEEEDAEEEEKGKKMAGNGSSKGAKQSAATKAKMKEESADGEAAGRKRKRGSGGEQEPSAALKVGTPIGVETLNLKSKKKKKVNGENADVESDAVDTPAKGKGKGAGKAHIVAAALAAKAKADEEKGKGQSSMSTNGSMASAAASSPSTTSAAIRPMAVRPNGQIVGPLSASPRPQDPNRPMQSNVRPAASGPGYYTSVPPLAAGQAVRPIAGVPSQAGVRPVVGGLGSMSTAPYPISSTSSLNRPPTATSPQQPLPPAGPGIKPDLSNIDLIRDALTNPLSLSRGGKLTLQEIYEDISGKYEWYRNNNRTNGRDWHSSIRHAVGNSKDIVRIPKKAGQQGKGVLYAFSDSEAAKEYLSSEHANGTMPVQSGTPASPTPPVISAATAMATNTSAIPRPPPNAVAAAPRPIHPTQPNAAAARPPPQIQSNTRVTIVIGKAPAEALAQMASVPKNAMTRSIETLFKGPPIVHHEGKLFLNPVVFGHMSASEVNDIGGKGAQQALALLQAQLLKHLQTVLPPKPGQSASPQPARPPVNGAAASPQTVHPPPPPLPANGMQNPSAPRPPVNVGRPVQVRPGVPPSAQSYRPGPPSSTVVPGPQSRPPPVGAPNAVRPVSNGVPPRPMVRPGAVAPPSARPQPPQARPPMMTNGQAMMARPTLQAPRPPTGQAVSAPGQVTASATVRPNPVPRPGPAPPAAAAQIQAQRPVRPVQSQASPRPAQPIPRPPPSSVSTSASTAPLASPARPAAAPTAAAAAPSSNAMMSAMQALASHPDAAGLMTILSTGKMDSNTKMTPGQLELLQRAGRIAAEQQRAQQQQQQQKTGTAPVPAPTSSPAPTPAPSSSASTSR